MKNKNNMKEGFIALTSVLIISSLVLLISIGLSARSISETNIAMSQQLSNKALALADACAEDALLKLRSDFNYAGNETIMINGSDSCDILSVEGSGGLNRIIKTESDVRGYKKKIRINIAQLNPLQITSWQEVADF